MMILNEDQRCFLACIELEEIANRHHCLLKGNISKIAKDHNVGVRKLNQYIKEHNIKFGENNDN